MKKIFLIIILAIGLNLKLISQERDLLEKAIIEEAITKEQKKALSVYFRNISKEKRKISDSIMDSAFTAYGGKTASDAERAKRLREQAKNLKASADYYEALADKILNEADSMKSE